MSSSVELMIGPRLAGGDHGPNPWAVAAQAASKRKLSASARVHFMRSPPRRARANLGSSAAAVNESRPDCGWNVSGQLNGCKQKCCRLLNQASGIAVAAIPAYSALHTRGGRW